MPENCPESCPVLPRVEALERANEKHSKTHEKLFERLGRVESDTGKQGVTLDNMDKKLDRLLDWQDENRDRIAKIDGIAELSAKVEEIESKPVKRWDGLVDKLIWAVAGAVVMFLLAKIGL